MIRKPVLMLSRMGSSARQKKYKHRYNVAPARRLHAPGHTFVGSQGEATSPQQ